MSTDKGIWFARRPHGGDSLSKRIRPLEAPSILSWFQLQIDEARIATDPSAVGQAELGGEVEELSKLFRAVRDEFLRTPRSMTALRKMLREHLWPGADAEATKQWVLADNQTLRIVPPGASSALLFFDRAVAADQPERFSFLLHQVTDLPLEVSQESFASPFDLPTFDVGDAHLGSTYVCSLRGVGPSPGQVLRLRGVDLPRLPGLLRIAGDTPTDWPEELQTLQSAMQPDDVSLTPALRRLADAFVAGADGVDGPAPALFDSDHAILLNVNAPGSGGHRCWIAFDERWAAAHGALAISILQYALCWDPCARLKAPAAPRAAKPARARATADKPTRTPRKPRPTKAAVQAEAEQRATWTEGLKGRTQHDAQAYNPRLFFDEGAVILHAKFGLGFVSRAEPTKCEVVFEHDVRLLVHGMGGQPSKDPIRL